MCPPPVPALPAESPPRWPPADRKQCFYCRLSPLAGSGTQEAALSTEMLGSALECLLLFGIVRSGSELQQPMLVVLPGSLSPSIGVCPGGPAFRPAISHPPQCLPGSRPVGPCAFLQPPSLCSFRHGIPSAGHSLPTERTHSSRNTVH